MPDYEQLVFISYAWGGEREEIVNQIDQTLQARGIKITRDKRDLGYKGSIKEFMERIGQGNCVIVVVSDKYLRSPNCMFELVEIAENKQFHDRIFPIVLADADIYDPVKRIGYVKHWEIKRAELADAMKAVDPANLQGIREDMDLYDRIRDKISGMASILKDMNTLTSEMHQDSNFSVLYDAIEKRLKESPVQSAEKAKEAKTTEGAERKGKVDKISATNGSIGIGKIDIGGVSGNIVIGNHNQVSHLSGSNKTLTDRFSQRLDEITRPKAISPNGERFFRKIKNAPPFLGIEKPAISLDSEHKFYEHFSAKKYVEEKGEVIRGTGSYTVNASDESLEDVSKRIYGDIKFVDHLIKANHGAKTLPRTGTVISSPLIDVSDPYRLSSEDIIEKFFIADYSWIEPTIKKLASQFYLGNNEVLELMKMIYDAAQIVRNEEK